MLISSHVVASPISSTSSAFVEANVSPPYSMKSVVEDVSPARSPPQAAEKDMDATIAETAAIFATLMKQISPAPRSDTVVSDIHSDSCSFSPFHYGRYYVSQGASSSPWIIQSASSVVATVSVMPPNATSSVVSGTSPSICHSVGSVHTVSSPISSISPTT